MKANELTIMQARQQLDRGELSSVELVSECLKQIKRLNKKLNACLLVDEKGALTAACEADRRLKAGEKGDLLGIPFLAKDNIMTKGLKTTAASKLLKNYIAPYDATVIERLKTAGAILLGKTNLDEFAHGSSTEYSAYGVTKNPWDLSRVPGGSSGGSAAAVAAHICLFALGTDTGGSVRHPAAFCGVTGYKPTYGLCSRFGLIAMTSSTDVPGILAKNSSDALSVLQVIAGADERDATTAATGKQAVSTKVFSWKGLKIGVLKNSEGVKLAPAVQKAYDTALAHFKKNGAKIIPVTLPLAEYAVAAYYIITPSEVSSNLARFDGLRFGQPAKKAKNLLDSYLEAREDGFGPEVKRRIMLGTFALSAGYVDAYYHKALQVREGIESEFSSAFKRCDVIVTPTTPTAAFKIGAKKNPLAMYLEDIFSVPASLAGLPAISVPACKKPLPIGLQFIGNKHADGLVLAAGARYEEELNLQDKPKL